MFTFKMLSKREKTLLFLSLAVVSFVLILNFILLPVINGFQALNQEIAFYQLNLKKSFRLLAREQWIKQDYNQISSLAKLEAKDEAIITLVLAKLENLAVQAGLQIIDVRPQSSRHLGQYNEIVIEIKQEGRIEQFLRFIYGLEDPQHLLRIKKLQLNSKVTPGILEGRLLISKIYLPFEKP